MELILKTTDVADKLKMVTQQIYDGEVNPLQAMVTAKPIMDALAQFKKDVNPYAIDEARKYDKGQTAYGCTFEVKNGRRMVQYSDDEKYKALEKQLKDRKTQLDAALKSSEPMFDAEGVEIPKVSIKYAAESLTIKTVE